MLPCFRNPPSSNTLFPRWQELDIRLGVSLSRFQTLHFRDRYLGLDSSVLSFGPCQTPTLGLVVQRHLENLTFQSEPFWVIDVHLDLRAGGANPGGAARSGEDGEDGTLQLTWARGRCFNEGAARLLLDRALGRVTAPGDGGVGGGGGQGEAALVVVRVTERPSVRGRPQPLCTVELLKQASKTLGIGPHAAMNAAERLYLNGYISCERRLHSKEEQPPTPPPLLF